MSQVSCPAASDKRSGDRVVAGASTRHEGALTMRGLCVVGLALLAFVACGLNSIQMPTPDVGRLAHNEAISVVKAWLPQKPPTAVQSANPQSKVLCLAFYERMTDWRGLYLGSGAWWVAATDSDGDKWEWRVYENTLTVEPISTDSPNVAC